MQARGTESSIVTSVRELETSFEPCSMTLVSVCEMQPPATSE